MNDQAALMLVDTLRRAYPTYPLDEPLYLNAMMQTDAPVAACAAAVARWVANESYAPKVSELLDAIDVEQASLPVPSDRMLPGPSADKRAAKVWLDVLRTVLEEFPRSMHNHAAGIDACPVCASRPATAARFAERCRELIEAHRDVLVVDDSDDLFRCSRCLDTGYETEQSPDGSIVLVPCPCYPARYDRWRDGHYAPRHRCSACEAVVRARR